MSARYIEIARTIEPNTASEKKRRKISKVDVNFFFLFFFKF